MRRIIGMRILPFIIMVLASLPISPAVLGTYSGGSFLDAVDAYASLSTGEVYAAAGPYSYGVIDRRGLFRAIDDPHSGRLSLIPSVSRPGRWDERSGSVLELGPASIAYTQDDRPAAAFAYGSEHISLALLFAFPGKASDSFHADRGRTEQFSTLYAGIGAHYGPVSGYAVYSFSPDIGSRSLVSGRLENDGYSIGFAYGSLIALYSDSPGYSWSVSASIGEEGFRAEGRIAYGLPPVSSGDFLPFESELFTMLEAGDARIFTHAEHRFSASGRTMHEDTAGLSYGIMDIWYSTISGPGIQIDCGHFGFGYRDGNAFVSFSASFRTGMARISVEASTDRGVKTGLRIDL